MAAPATAPRSLAARQDLASKQRKDQERVSLLLSASVAQTWPLLDHKNVKASMPHWLAAMYALIHRFGNLSSTLAKHYLEDGRPKELPHFSVVQHEPASYEQVVKSLKWATQGLYDPQPNFAAIETLVQGVAQKDVQDAARGTYMDYVKDDRQVRAWARDAKPDACSFCALLATRGPVYKSEAAADFKAHDHCHCVAVPIYRDEKYVAPLYVDRWLELYKESAAGKSGAAARAAFRRALAHN